MRRIYRVLPDEDGWKVEVKFGAKDMATLLARYYADEDWTFGDIPTQVVVHKKDGKIETEWTYGEDPERTEG